MKVATFESKGFQKVGVFIGDHLIDVDLLFETLARLTEREFPEIFSIIDAIEYWDEVVKSVEKGQKLFKESFFKLFSVRNPELSVTICRESKVICLGKNYLEHAKEVGSPPPKEPIIFGKFADCAIAHGDEIIYPDWVTRLDPEVELAVIIGAGGYSIPKEEAYEHVFGYTIANDVTARNIQTKDIKEALPWYRSKNFDTSMPIGPWIVTKDEIKNPHNLQLELSVNGNIRQKGNTKDMIFRIDHLIHFISKYTTLYPGDVILTGTVSGIAPIIRGDEIICKIEGIGELINRVV